MVAQDKICISSTKATTVSFITSATIIICFYLLYKSIISLKYSAKEPNNTSSIKEIKSALEKTASKIYNSFRSTSQDKTNIYPESRYVHSRSIEPESRNVGYIYSQDFESQKFPLYEQILDRRYYYHINYFNQGSSVPINIPIETRNNNQIYDGESISIPEIFSGSPMTVKLYSQQLRYY